MIHLNTLAIQSYSFGGDAMTNEQVLEHMNRLGLKRAEFCDPHLHFEDPDTLKQNIERIQNSGIQAVSVGVCKLDTEPRIRARFQAARTLGAKQMSVTFHPEGMWDVFNLAEKLAEEYDLQLAIHNHGGHDWLGNVKMLQYIFENVSPRFGLSLDTAWALDAGVEPEQWVETFADRLQVVHLKDVHYAENQRKPVDNALGEGQIDVPAVLGALGKVNFAGHMVLEVESEEADPIAPIERSLAYLKSLS